MKIKLSTKIPGPKAQKVVSFYDKYSALATHAYPLVIKDGKGCYIQDVDGNWFLDFTSQIASIALGYNHPAMMEVLKQYSKIGATKVTGTVFYNTEAERLTKNLLGIVPKKLGRAFLVNTGAEATENAMKLCWRKLGPVSGVTSYGAFHGRTIAALSHTHSKESYKRNYPEIPHHIIKFCTDDNDPDISMFDNLLHNTGKRPAFLIMEVFQGEGGYRIASPKFVKHLRKITEENEVPLILDEVQSGMGRTGKWWAFEHYKVEPDIMCASKGLRVGATIFEEKFNPKEKGAIGSTWPGGHRIDIALGSAVIETIKKEKLMDNAERIGKHILKRLKEMEGISNVRGMGLMIAFDCKSDSMKKETIEECFKNGLCLLGAGIKSIRIVPPLIITRKEADEGLDVLEKAISKWKK